MVKLPWKYQTTSHFSFMNQTQVCGLLVELCSSIKPHSPILIKWTKIVFKWREKENWRKNNWQAATKRGSENKWKPSTLTVKPVKDRQNSEDRRHIVALSQPRCSQNQPWERKWLQNSLNSHLIFSLKKCGLRSRQPLWFSPCDILGSLIFYSE